MNGETSVFGDAFPTRTAAEEAINLDIEEDNPTGEREDYDIHELKSFRNDSVNRSPLHADAPVPGAGRQFLRMEEG
jgi:hypothetical protein